MPKNTQSYQLPPAPSMSIPFGSTLSTMGLGGTGQAVTHSPFMGSNLSAYGAFPNRDTSLQPLKPAPSAAALGMSQKQSHQNQQAQMPVWWGTGSNALPNQSPFNVAAHGGNHLIPGLNIHPSDPMALFQAWMKGPSGPIYQQLKNAPPGIAQSIVQGGIPDQLKWDIVQDYGGGAAYQPGGPLAAGGLYGPAATPAAPQPFVPPTFTGGPGSTTPQQNLAGWANLGNAYAPNSGGGGIQIVNGKPTWVGPAPTLKK